MQHVVSTMAIYGKTAEQWWVTLILIKDYIEFFSIVILDKKKHTILSDSSSEDDEPLPKEQLCYSNSLSSCSINHANTPPSSTFGTRPDNSPLLPLNSSFESFTSRENGRNKGILAIYLLMWLTYPVRALLY